MPVEIFAWPGNPGKGLLATAKDGELPAVLQATNRHGMPRHILLAQRAVVAVMSGSYFIIEDVAVVFFLLSAMTVALYLGDAQKQLRHIGCLGEIV
jgi:amino acid permease